MKGAQNVFFLWALLLLFLFSWAFVPPSPAQQEVRKENTEEIQANEEPEKVVGAPQDIKEKTGILVFVAWMWISIAVLVYFLRLKIKETDRLYSIKYFLSDKK